MTLQGKVFNRLTVLMDEPIQKRANGHRYYKVRCECGTEKWIRGTSLTYANTGSCGCLQREAIKGHKYSLTHGESKTPTWSVWVGLRSRCSNPNNSKYPNYGGRGVTFCERWKEYSNFLEDMGRRPSSEYSIDRIDVNGNYEPSNCRWTTAKVQARNKTTTLFVRFKGVDRKLTELCEELGIRYKYVHGRVRKGHNLEVIITRAIELSYNNT